MEHNMSEAPLLIRYFQPGEGPRLGIMLDDRVYDVSDRFPTLASFFQTILRTS